MLELVRERWTRFIDIGARFDILLVLGTGAADKTRLPEVVEYDVWGVEALALHDDVAG